MASPLGHGAAPVAGGVVLGEDGDIALRRGYPPRPARAGQRAGRGASKSRLVSLMETPFGSANATNSKACQPSRQSQQVGILLMTGVAAGSDWNGSLGRHLTVSRFSPRRSLTFGLPEGPCQQPTRTARHLQRAESQARGD